VTPGAMRILKAAENRECGLREWFIGEDVALEYSYSHGWLFRYEGEGDDYQETDRRIARIILRGLLDESELATMKRERDELVEWLDGLVVLDQQARNMIGLFLQRLKREGE